MEIYNNELYVVGSFNWIGTDSSLRYIAKWNGSNWSNVGNVFTVIHNAGQQLSSLCVYNNELYVAGQLSQPVTFTPMHLIKWDGTSWSLVGNGMVEGGVSLIHDMEVYNNELYIGGYFSPFATGGSGTSSCLTKWDGTQYKNIGGPGFDEVVRCMAIHHNKLYVGGGFTYVNGIPARCIASYDGINWCGYPTIAPLNIVSVMGAYKDSLVIAGGVFVVGSDTLTSVIVRWTGDTMPDSCKLANGILEMGVAENYINVYPNPTNGNITVSLASIENTIIAIRVFNTYGAIVYNINGINNKVASLNLDQSSGIYYIEIATTKEKHIKKIVVNRN
jgi:hypothetical protein